MIQKIKRFLVKKGRYILNVFRKTFWDDQNVSAFLKQFNIF